MGRMRNGSFRFLNRSEETSSNPNGWNGRNFHHGGRGSIARKECSIGESADALYRVRRDHGEYGDRECGDSLLPELGGQGNLEAYSRHRERSHGGRVRGASSSGDLRYGYALVARRSPVGNVQADWVRGC